MSLARTSGRIAAAATTAGVALAVAAAPAMAAASGSIVATGLNTPGGTVKLGTDLWVSDHVNGFCRLDRAATGKLTITLSTCNTSALSPGQPAFDPATSSVYVPDNSTKGTGVVRLSYNAATRTVSPAGAIVTGPAGSKPTATALSADGRTLYVSSIRSGNVAKIANPSGKDAAGAPVAPSVNQAFAATSDGRGAAGLTIANNSAGALNPDGTIAQSLYLAEGGGISEVNAASGGAAFLNGAIMPQTTVGGKAVLWESLDVVAQSPGVLAVAKWAPHDLGTKVTISQFNIAAGASSDYSTTYTAPDGRLQPWTSVSDLAVNPAGGLYVSHDPTNGGTNGAVVSTLP